MLFDIQGLPMSKEDEREQGKVLWNAIIDQREKNRKAKEDKANRKIKRTPKNKKK